MLHIYQVRWFIGLGALVAGIDIVSGQEYPNKGVRIVTSAVGGGNDVAVRLIAPSLAAGLGQQVIVDNRGGVAPGETVSKSAPDGYTVLYASGSFWIGSLLRNTPYDPVKDFSPVTLVASTPNVLAVHPSLQVKSVKELIALAKARPGQLTYASGNPGASAHLATELLKAMAGIDMLGVPYKGTGPALQDLVGGQVQLMFVNPSPAMPYIKSGRLRALAITSAQQSALLPDLPTVSATGVPGYESVSLDGMFAPVNTPAAVINRLNQEMVRVLNRAEIKDKFLSVGAETVGSSPEQLSSAMKSEMFRMGKVIKDVGIRGD